MKTCLVLGIILGVLMGCSSNSKALKSDFRENSIYGKTELLFKHTDIQKKGTILLIHGTAPQNIRGEIAWPEALQFFSQKAPNHYIIQPTYEALSDSLNKLGWDTVRYTRLGVYRDHVDTNEYGKTDLENLVTQLKNILKMIPKDAPRVVFCWSGGSVHALQLPLDDIDALIILGGIATKRTEIARLRAHNEDDLKKINAQLDEILSQEGKVSREDMLGKDMPFGRFFDENNLADNWTYLSHYQFLSTLVIHGEKDEEADVSQAMLWKEKLPDHKITRIIKKDGNHAWGTKGNEPDMVDLAKTIDKWLDEAL